MKNNKQIYSPKNKIIIGYINNANDNNIKGLIKERIDKIEKIYYETLNKLFEHNQCKYKIHKTKYEKFKENFSSYK